MNASDAEAAPPPHCPTCGEAMRYRGGTFGWVCCGWMLLYRAGGWLDGDGKVLQDRRLVWR